MFSSIAASSITPAERSRKIVSTVLQALTQGKQVAISTVTGLSESQISRMKNDQLQSWADLLAYAGLQVVSADDVMVDITTYEAVSRLIVKAMSTPDIVHLILQSPQK